MPTSITCAAITGAPWRFLAIPRWVRRRSEKAQSHWVSWRARRHYVENDGKLILFGDITGYRYLKAPNVSVMLDINGRYAQTEHEEFVPGGGVVVLKQQVNTGEAGY